MHGCTHRWITPPSIDPGPDPGPSPSRLDPRRRSLLHRVLASRGVEEPHAVEAWTNPRLTALHDPSDLPGLDRAARRLLDALDRRERIVIYGDYDVDGVAGSAILLRICKTLRPDAPVEIYIPHRLEEGYGLNVEALRSLQADGAALVVSVDCGVRAMGPAAEARRLGLDLIITDHHTPPEAGEDLPDAFCVVHPRLAGSPYPFGDLCGAGVAFKLAWRLATLEAGGERVGARIRETLLDLLSLAALGTIADVVPLVDENRLIARHGLARMRSTSIIGLDALIEASRLDNPRLTAEDVGFRIGPRLNACGRLGHASEAARLLTTEDAGESERLAAALTELNERRRAEQRTIAEQAEERAVEAGMTGDDRLAIVLADEAWHPGIIGIVCSRLVDRFRRPTVLLQRDNGVCRGSCRSVEGLDIHEALGACAEHLETYGGHAMAAGLRLRTERLEAFAESFAAAVAARLSPEDLRPTLRIDCAASMDELTPEQTRALEALGPFGAGNPPPAILLRGVTLVGAPQPLGQRGRHVKLTLRQGSSMLRALGWGWGERRDRFPPGRRIDVVVRPELNEWRGRVTVEPTLLDASFGTGEPGT